MMYQPKNPDRTQNLASFNNKTLNPILVDQRKTDKKDNGVLDIKERRVSKSANKRVAFEDDYIEHADSIKN
jgi:hypothetical protein